MRQPVTATILQNLVLLLLILVVPSLYAKDTQSPGYAPGDPQLCLNCHGNNAMLPAAEILKTPHGNTANPKAPMSEHGCQGCHGPSAQHLSQYVNGKPAKPTVTFDDSTPAEKRSAVCLGCHEDRNQAHWQGSPHQFEGVTCDSCHSVHKASDPVLRKQSQTDICFTCHQDKRAQIHQSSSHPIAEGLMACSDCHNPHGGAVDKMLSGISVNDTCYQCHAEKRGPFLWEHAPVRESCVNCHEPHGSMHRPMLVSRQPWLCQQCHMAPFHPSTAYSGADMPPSGAAQQVLARSCLNCHTQVHGSNHPSGVGLIR